MAGRTIKTSTTRPANRRGNRKPVPANARDAILKAAEEEFAARGFGGARAESIAKRAGVNKALPFYHFGSKADLYNEVVKSALGRLGEFMADAIVAQSPAERVGIFVHRLFEYLADNPNWSRLIVRELIDEPARARAIAAQYLKPLVEGGRELMLRDIRAGLMRECDPVHLMIGIILEVFGYFLLNPFLQGVGIARPVSDANLAAREAAVIDLLINGFGMAGPQPAASTN